MRLYNKFVLINNNTIDNKQANEHQISKKIKKANNLNHIIQTRKKKKVK